MTPKQNRAVGSNHDKAFEAVGKVQGWRKEIFHGQ